MKAIFIIISFFVLAASESAPQLQKAKNVTINETAKAEFPNNKMEGSTTINRVQRECTMSDLSKLNAHIIIVLERQVEKMIKDDYIGNFTESVPCTRYHGLTMNFPIRWFIRSTVEKAVSEYKLELIEP